MLHAALESLASKGEWEKTDTEIIDLASISRSTFYKLKLKDESTQQHLLYYRRKALGRGPARPDGY